MTSGASRIHPVEVDILPSTQIPRGTVSDVPLDQLDHATLSRKFSRGMDQETKEALRSGLTLEEVRWSSMRRKIPGMSSIPKNKSKMYVDLDPHTKVRIPVVQNIHLYLMESLVEDSFSLLPYFFSYKTEFFLPKQSQTSRSIL